MSTIWSLRTSTRLGGLWVLSSNWRLRGQWSLGGLWCLGDAKRSSGLWRFASKHLSGLWRFGVLRSLESTRKNLLIDLNKEFNS